MKHFSLILLLFVVQYQVSAQNQNPPDILWKSIKSPHFEVIFPNEIVKEAQRITNTLEWAYNHDTKSLNIKPKPISIVLYTQSNISNAFAALSPRRMGWYLTPPQSITSLGSVDWVQTLAMHEYRHVVQYAKNKQHFTKFVTYLFGDMGQYMMRWSIPDWFFEGDAIDMETALSNGGRGRLPAFSMYIRTYSLTNEKFTYDQAYLGSYKRYYPNHYNLGYPLTAYGRSRYGKDIWDNVLERTSKISYWPFAFSGSVKKITGLNANKFYNSAIADFNETWEKQNSEITTTEARIINTKKKKNWTNYFNPQYTKDGDIISGKESLDKIPAFYKITPDGKEKKIKNTDAGIFNLADEKAAWSRNIPDIRWGEKGYSDIVIYDLKTKHEKRLSRKTKYLSPAISPDGKRIAVVEYSPDQKSNLCILDAKSGLELNRYNIGKNDYIRTPVWSGDSRYIAFSNANFNGTALSVIEIQTGEIKTINAASWENNGKPVFYKNYLIYNSDYSGIGNIYATDLTTGQRYQITSRHYGAYNAAISPEGNKMLFQDYTKMGFDIAEMDLNPEKWKKIEEVKLTLDQYYKPLVEQEGNVTISESMIPDTSYSVTKYKKLRDALNIHTWGVYPHPTDLEVSVTSNNYLNTLGIMAGYLYNVNEKTNTGFLSFNFAKYFPILTVISSYGQREETVALINIPGLYTDRWEEFRTNASIGLPFNLSRGVYSTSLSFKGGLGYTSTTDRDVTSVTRKPNGNFTTFSGEINFSRTQQYAYRDFAPKWGQYLTVIYTQIPNSSEKEGYLFSGHASFYFPGLFPQHSLKLSGAYEKQLTYDPNNHSNSYYFSSMVSYPRGYELPVYDELYKFSADYQFPVWYPDISLGPIAYIKRIRAGAFFDYANGFLAGTKDEYQSVGGSIMVEFKLFKINYPFEAGVQYARTLTDSQNHYSLLILGLPF